MKKFIIKASKDKKDYGKGKRKQLITYRTKTGKMAQRAQTVGRKVDGKSGAKKEFQKYGVEILQNLYKKNPKAAATNDNILENSIVTIIQTMGMGKDSSSYDLQKDYFPKKFNKDLIRNPAGGGESFKTPWYDLKDAGMKTVAEKALKEFRKKNPKVKKSGTLKTFLSFFKAKDADKKDYGKGKRKERIAYTTSTGKKAYRMQTVGKKADTEKKPAKGKKAEKKDPTNKRKEIKQTGPSSDEIRDAGGIKQAKKEFMEKKSAVGKGLSQTLMKEYNEMSQGDKKLIDSAISLGWKPNDKAIEEEAMGETIDNIMDNPEEYGKKLVELEKEKIKNMTPRKLLVFVDISAQEFIDDYDGDLRKLQSFAMDVEEDIILDSVADGSMDPQEIHEKLGGEIDKGAIEIALAMGAQLFIDDQNKGSGDSYTFKDTGETVIGEKATLNKRLDSLFAKMKKLDKDWAERAEKIDFGKMNPEEFDKVVSKRNKDSERIQNEITRAHQELYNVKEKPIKGKSKKKKPYFERSKGLGR